MALKPNRILLELINLTQYYQSTEVTERCTDLKKSTTKNLSTTNPSPMGKRSKFHPYNNFNVKCSSLSFQCFNIFLPLCVYQEQYFEALTFHLSKAMFKPATGQMYNLFGLFKLLCLEGIHTSVQLRTCYSRVFPWWNGGYISYSII